MSLLSQLPHPVPMALCLAIGAHEGRNHRRKYTNESYVVHLEAVALTVWSATLDPYVTAAAVLHDVLEDTDLHVVRLEELFDPSIARWVVELTDPPLPGLNRAARMEQHRIRLSQASRQAQTIKYADLIDNTASITTHDPKFARVYLAEKQALLETMTDGDPDLYTRALQTLWDAQAKLAA